MSNEKRKSTADIQKAAATARQLLRSFQWSGIQTLPKPRSQHRFALGIRSLELDAQPPPPSFAEVREPVVRPSDAQVVAPSSVSPELYSATLDGYDSELLNESERTNQLQLVQTEVSGCIKCAELAACRTNTVFGVGNVKPQLCFLGEGPGADEDRQGEPFVGAAGQLLNRIIESCHMKREDVYILNTVKCRPPGNRNPAEDELANCWPYAVRQLEILQPDFICCLGSVAARTLLGTRQSIGRLRGQFFTYRGSQVVVTYHPAYLLRNPGAKRQVWDDMKMLMTAMDRSV